MDIDFRDIEKNIKVMAAASGVSLADIARGVGDKPQNFSNKLKCGKMQKDLDYLSRVAAVCGYDFEYKFVKKEE